MTPPCGGGVEFVVFFLCIWVAQWETVRCFSLGGGWRVVVFGCCSLGLAGGWLVGDVCMLGWCDFV